MRKGLVLVQCSKCFCENVVHQSQLKKWVCYRYCMEMQSGGKILEVGDR